MWPVRQALLVIVAVLCAADATHAASWVRTGPDGGTVPSVAFDAAGVAYAGTMNGVYVRAPGDPGWRFSGLMYPVVSMAADPAAAGVVWASNYGLNRTTDGGATWIPASNVAALTVVVDRVQPEIVYTTGDGQISKTTDGGAHWTTINI